MRDHETCYRIRRTRMCYCHRSRLVDCMGVRGLCSPAERRIVGGTISIALPEIERTECGTVSIRGDQASFSIHSLGRCNTDRFVNFRWCDLGSNEGLAERQLGTNFVIASRNFGMALCKRGSRRLRRSPGWQKVDDLRRGNNYYCLRPTFSDWCVAGISLGRPFYDWRRDIGRRTGAVLGKLLVGTKPRVRKRFMDQGICGKGGRISAICRVHRNKCRFLSGLSHPSASDRHFRNTGESKERNPFVL